MFRPAGVVDEAIGGAFDGADLLPLAAPAVPANRADAVQTLYVHKLGHFTGMFGVACLPDMQRDTRVSKKRHHDIEDLRPLPQAAVRIHDHGESAHKERIHRREEGRHHFALFACPRHPGDALFAPVSRSDPTFLDVL